MPESRRSGTVTATMPAPEPQPIPLRTAPASGTSGRPRGWSKHWPLPVSMMLAIVYWVHLNQTVTRTLTISPRIGVVRSGTSDHLASGRLNLRLPGTDWVITKLLDDVDKEMDPAEARVEFTIRAPGGYLTRISETVWIVDVDPGAEAGLIDHAAHQFRISADKLREANGKLQSYITKMDPPSMTVFLERSGSINVSLSRRNVAILAPDTDDWKNRIFLDSLEFAPDFTTLVGPRKQLESISDASELFVMDIREPLAQLKTWSPYERKSVAATLRLKEHLVAKGIQVSGQLRASVRVAPKPTEFKNFKVQVAADWVGSALNADEFLVSESVTVDIHSHNHELTQILSVPKQAEEWVRQHVRCHVFLNEIPASTDFAKPDFQRHPQPWFSVFHPRFENKRDIVIFPRDLVTVKRK